MNVNRVEKICIEAGNAVMRLREDGYDKANKSDGSPVTEADIEADRIISSGLKDLAPNIPAITEETWTETSAQEPEQYWCIDPIDGTKGFISGKPDFTVNIALIKDRYPVLGVIYAPALGIMWTGHEGAAWKRQTTEIGDNITLEKMGDAAAISARPVRLDKPDIVATKAHRTAELDQWINSLNANTSTPVGSSLKFCVIAEGEADLYPRIGPTMEWDTAAGQAILEAAGGRVLGPDAKRFYYGKSGRLNGYFTAMGNVTGNLPENWIAPKKAEASNG